MLVITSVLLFGMFLFSENEKPVPLKPKPTSDENMVYFDVNSQNAPSIPVVDSQSQIDETELNADEYNKQMVETLAQRPSVKLPVREIPIEPTTELPAGTFVIPPPTHQKHHARKVARAAHKTYHSRKYHRYNYPNTCMAKIIKPSQAILSEPKISSRRPIFAEAQVASSSIRAVKTDYVNAFEIADFINKNIPKDSTLARARGGNEIILAGTDDDIATAEKIIALLDTHPKVAAFKLNYTKPCKMASMLANSVFSGDCNVIAEGDENSCKKSPFTIYYNNDQNSITVVGASSKQMDLVQEFVNFSDVKSPQACLDILFVEFNEKGSRQFQKLACLNGFSCQKECSVSGKNIYSEVSSIISAGGGKILAKPHLTVANDSNYCINVTSDYVQSRQGKYVYNIEDCGTRLKIHSLINPKGEVFLTLEPQYVTVKRSIPNERNAKATLFNRRCFCYENIRLKDCQTLCLGGVNSQQEYNCLGIKRTKNSELMMFVNAHVTD